jgi:hypothetical protein
MGPGVGLMPPKARRKRDADPAQPVDLSIDQSAQGCECCANCAHHLARDEMGGAVEGQYVPCTNCGGAVTSSRGG